MIVADLSLEIRPGLAVCVKGPSTIAGGCSESSRVCFLSFARPSKGFAAATEGPTGATHDLPEYSAKTPRHALHAPYLKFWGCAHRVGLAYYF